MRTAWGLIGLNAGWFACVLGAAWNMHWLGLAVVPVIAAIHACFVPARDVLPTMALVAGAVLLGLVLDSALIAVGAYEPNRWILPFPLATLWLLLLWANFSLALNTALQWLQGHLFIAALLGAVFGPVAYLAAERLGAIHLAANRGVLLIGLAWFAAMPLMSWTARVLFRQSMRLRKR